MLAILSSRVWQRTLTHTHTHTRLRSQLAHRGNARQVWKHGRQRFHLWEMNSGATRSLFSLRLGRLNRLLYTPGKLFIRAEVKDGGGGGGAEVITAAAAAEE